MPTAPSSDPKRTVETEPEEDIVMTDRKRRARLRLIRRLVEGPEPDPAVLDTYQANDEEALSLAADASEQAGARWMAVKRGQIDHAPRLK